MRVVFIGTGEIGLPSLRMLLVWGGCEVVGVVTQPDRAAGRGLNVKESPIKQAAREAGVPCLQPVKLRDSAAVAELAALRPEVIVVMAYGQILSREVLAIPTLACLNLHGSLLPRWRGAAPIQAAIAAGDAVTGITVMHMAEGLDTGDIVLMDEIGIGPEETGGSLHDRLAELAPVSLGRALDRLVAGKAPRVPQDESAVTVTKKLTREDGKIDWDWSAAEIERLVRAMDPWPGAWCELEVGGQTRRLKVWRVAGADGLESRVVGEVKGVEGCVVVGTGAGALILQEVQAEGRKRMSAGDWWRGVGG